MNLYNRKPFEVKGGIPFFTNPDEYTQNYEDISSHHTQNIKDRDPNPWIPIDIWNEMENSTIDLFTNHSKVKNKKRKLKLLDVGVGLGRLLEKLCSDHENIDPYGMDISMSYLQLAKTKGIDVCYSKIEDMPYSDQYFDVILCTDVLEHVIDLNLCVTKILSVLKKGGLLIIRVPNREDLSSYLDPEYPYDLAHVRNFDRSNLEALFTKIFPHKVIAFAPGLYQKRPDWLKYKLPFNLYFRIIFKILKILEKYFPNYERQILKKLFHPIEMNVVIKKT